MDLENKTEECPKHYQNFEKTSVKVLDAHAPRKILRGHHKPYVDKFSIKDFFNKCDRIRRKLQI